MRKRVILGALMVAGLTFWGCGSPSAPTASVTPSPSPASAQVEVPPEPPRPARSSTAPSDSGLRTATIENNRGNPWKLEAEQLRWTDERRRARAITVKFQLTDPERKKTTRVRAAGAVVNVDAEQVDFEGQVRVEGPGGEVLTVNRLVWDGKDRRFYGDDGVRLVRGASVLEGERLVATPDLRQFEILGDVRGSMNLEEGQES